MTRQLRAVASYDSCMPMVLSLKIHFEREPNRSMGLANLLKAENEHADSE